MKPFDCKTWSDVTAALAHANDGDCELNILADVRADRPVLVGAGTTGIRINFRNNAAILATETPANNNIIEIRGDRTVVLDHPWIVGFREHGAAFKFLGDSDVIATNVSGTNIYGRDDQHYSQYFSGHCRSFRYTINALGHCWRHKREHFNYLCTRVSNIGSGGVAINCGSLVSPNSAYLGSAGSVVMLSGTRITGRPAISWDGKMFSAPIMYKSQPSDVLIARDLTVVGETTGPLYIGHFGGVNLLRDNDYSGVTLRGSFASWLGVGERTWEQHRGECGEGGSKPPQGAIGERGEAKGG